jgi:hypothetical protein
MSTQPDITIDQGSSLDVVFTIQQENSSAYDLTGYDARLQVRRTYGDTTALINCTLANSKLVLTDAVGGVLTLSLAPADTSSIRFNSKDDDTLDCVYDLEIQSVAGKVFKPAKGSFILAREVTR